MAYKTFQCVFSQLHSSGLADSLPLAGCFLAQLKLLHKVFPSNVVGHKFFQHTLSSLCSPKRKNPMVSNEDF